MTGGLWKGPLYPQNRPRGLGIVKWASHHLGSARKALLVFLAELPPLSGLREARYPVTVYEVTDDETIVGGEAPLYRSVHTHPSLLAQ